MDRFRAKYVIQPDGCWLWTGATNSRGYGCLGVLGKGWLAHRWSYTIHVGPIPDGLTLDHLCKNILCCNPMHLEPVTRAENIRRGGNTIKTHCKRGHPLSGENLRVRSDGKRTCRTCNKDTNKASRERVAARGCHAGAMRGAVPAAPEPVTSVQTTPSVDNCGIDARQPSEKRDLESTGRKFDSPRLQVITE